jgi:hypothetical protein
MWRVATQLRTFSPPFVSLTECSEWSVCCLAVSRPGLYHLCTSSLYRNNATWLPEHLSTETYQMLNINCACWILYCTVISEEIFRSIVFTLVSLSPLLPQTSLSFCKHQTIYFSESDRQYRVGVSVFDNFNIMLRAKWG